MGTNFYVKPKPGEPLEDMIHLGNRSAAGRYCWNCLVTLCCGGEDCLHQGAATWYVNCPQCGKPYPEYKSFEQGNAAGVELGFSKPNTTKPSGVATASSFTYAVRPDELDDLISNGVVDEYHREFTVQEFLAMLECQCPIRFYGSIGKEFS